VSIAPKASPKLEPTPTPEADPWYEETGQGMGETLKVASMSGQKQKSL